MTEKWMARTSREQEPGRGNPLAIAAGCLNTSSRNSSGCGMTRLQILFLRRLHGLTETQAQMLAAVIWERLT